MTNKRFFHPDQLTAIRAGCDWRKLLDDLGVRADVRRCTDTEFWGYSPFNTDEKTASFHMKAPGVWYDWSTHATAPGRSKPGGGVIELVQAIHGARGQILKLNEAASWLVEGGYTHIDDLVPASEPTSGEEKKENPPIDIDLAPRLVEHTAFTERGISAETCTYLRCGYLDSARGMLAKRLVFQVGGVSVDGQARTILTHMGRATTPEQEARGKWRFYRGFNPSLELYNLDNLLLNNEAVLQTIATKTIVLVEGAFDVAKCVEAGIKNVVASFGARLSDVQAEKLRGTLAQLNAHEVRVFYDRDTAGQKAATDAVQHLEDLGVAATAFDWQHQYGQSQKSIPDTIQDPCDFSTAQLRWLREQGMI